MVKKIKTAKQIEKYLKGVANHRRIEILFLIAGNGGLTLEQIANNIGGNISTICEHVLKLNRAGLIDKQYQGRSVIHFLTPYGRIFYNFLKNFRAF
jgi:DNA-binding transcriptional ArsR family regulator